MSDNRYLDAILELCEAMKKAGFFLTDEQALEVQIIYPIWTSTGTYAVGDRVRYNNALYRCLIAHTAQESWTPEAAASLWAKILTDPSGGILPWEQPDSTNPYKKGDKVTHNGKTWISTIDNNVWEPGVYGWEEVQ
jgi:chitodextrinase